MSQSPLIIDILRRTEEGDVTTIGTALDSTGGLIVLNGQSFDLAVGLDGLVYFTLPTIFADAEPDPGEPLGVLSDSSVSRIDPQSGEVEVVVSEVAINAAGIAFGALGDLYYGAVTSVAPLIIELRRATAGGDDAETVGIALDTSAGLISFLGQSFDLAALPHTVLLRLVNENECRPDCSPIGGDGAVSVQDLVTVLESWGTSYYGADIDASGLVDVQDLLSVVLAWRTARKGPLSSLSQPQKPAGESMATVLAGMIHLVREREKKTGHPKVASWVERGPLVRRFN